MGLGTGGRRVFLSIKDGQVIHKIGEDLKCYSHLTGVLTDVTVKEDGKYGRELHITLFDEDWFTIQIFLNSGYAMAFLSMIRNVDVTKPFTVIPSCKVIEGKKKMTMFISQGGKPVKWFFTKDNPQGMPEMEKVQRMNEANQPVEVWDSTNQMNFLLISYQDFVQPLLLKPLIKENMQQPDQAFQQPTPAPVQTKADQVFNQQWPQNNQGADTSNQPDDLPF